MSKHLPPIPPASRSPKGTGGTDKTQVDDGANAHETDRNYDKEGQQGNSKINTTHQGYQQDR
ncbi:MAG: uncharacterized protein JWR75_955 [Devosia sp.]|nr:uncharacterized protein [Devosia sp.]